MVLLSLRGTKQSLYYEYKSPKIASSFLLAMTDTLSSKNVNDGNYDEAISRINLLIINIDLRGLLRLACGRQARNDRF